MICYNNFEGAEITILIYPKCKLLWHLKYWVLSLAKETITPAIQTKL